MIVCVGRRIMVLIMLVTLGTAQAHGGCCCGTRPEVYRFASSAIFLRARGANFKFATRLLLYNFANMLGSIRPRPYRAIGTSPSACTAHNRRHCHFRSRNTRAVGTRRSTLAPMCGRLTPGACWDSKDEWVPKSPLSRSEFSTKKTQEHFDKCLLTQRPDSYASEMLARC